MQTLLDLVLIAFIAVLVIDKSGIVESIKYAISKALTKGKVAKTDFRLKPFDCSLCMTFWSCFIYLLIVGKVSIFTIAISLLLAVVAVPIIGDFIEIVNYLWCKLVKKLCRYDKQRNL